MWEKIKIISSSIWTFVLPFLRQLMSSAGPIIANAALSAVKVAAGTGLGNAEKRETAYQLICADLKAQGIRVGLDVGESLINASIEMALQKIKSE